MKRCTPKHLADRGQRLHSCTMLAVLVALVAVISVKAQDDMDQDMAGFDMGDESIAVRDPIEPVNRGFYHVNDKLYFWVVKPLAQGYSWVMPEPGREGVDNMFTNLGMPRRAVNCLLQCKMKATGTELSRFAINSTVGLLGFFDIAESRWDIESQDEDFGQTLGHYGMGYGIYLTWPLFGPSNPRDTVGLVVDGLLDPINYVVTDLPARIAIKAGDRVNYTSLHLGRYEQSKEVALDHYISLRESYTQYRKKQIRD